MTDPLVKAENLGFAHLPDSDSFSEPKWLFRGLSFSLCSGRGLIVSGPSGSGKTTLLSLAARNPALLPAAGRIEGTLSPYPGQRPAETGLLFQENRLLDHLPVIENATLAADLAGVPHSSGNRAAREMLTALGLGSMLNRKPRQISGGEARRAALVRAVIGAMTSPAPLLLADEPDSGLDAGSSRLVWELLERLIREKEMALLASSHGLMETEQVENPPWEGDLRLKNLVPSEGAADLSEVAPLKDLPFPEPRGFTSLRRLGVCLRLSLRHIAHRPLLFAVQCLCFCALLAIPATSLRFSSLLASEPIKRAAAFPLLVGAPGSPFQLVLADVYRRGSVDRTLNFRDFSKLSRKWKGRCYPLHCVHRAGEFPVTGTTPSYFQALGETLESGQLFQILGQAVAGASLAREMRLSPGSTFLAGNPDPWDVSGTPPVKLRVTGILAPTGSVDDRTLFVDLNTAWAMDSAIHGHVEASGQVSDPSMRMITDLSGGALDSFHLHGSRNSMKLSSVAMFPQGLTEEAVMAAETGLNSSTMVVRPRRVASETLDVIFNIKAFFDLHGTMLSLIMCLALGTILWLSFRFREAEANLLRLLGCGSLEMLAAMGSETLLALLTGAAVACVFSALALDRLLTLF